MEDELKIQTRYQKIDEIITTINGSERRKSMITEIELDDYIPKKEALKMLSDVQMEVYKLQTKIDAFEKAIDGVETLEDAENVVGEGTSR